MIYLLNRKPSQTHIAPLVNAGKAAAEQFLADVPVPTSVLPKHDGKNGHVHSGLFQVDRPPFEARHKFYFRIQGSSPRSSSRISGKPL